MKLRDYQESIKAASERFYDDAAVSRAQVYAPTGAGKTVCFTNLIEYAISKGATNIAVAHPRIALSQDQLRRIEKDFGESVTYSNFHSGKNPSMSVVRGISTTKTSELKKVIAYSHEVNRPHITLSSYHSFDKLNQSDITFDLIICDEAHYCTSDKFSDLLEGFKANKVIFYTATPVDSSNAKMRDTVTFGEVIESVRPVELIVPGYIVSPIVQRLDCLPSELNSGDDVKIVDIVKRAYVEQYKVTKEWGMPYHQMLVVARDVVNDLHSNVMTKEGLVDIQSYIAANTDIKITDIDIYVITANGAYCNDRALASRDEALTQIKVKGKNCIICHYDTLSEGIDIDTLSGCVILRELSKPKLIQTIGRCARPYVGDLTSDREPNPTLYKAGAYDHRVKKNCIVTVPVVEGQPLAGIDYNTVVEDFLFGDYNRIRHEVSTPALPIGAGTDEEMDTEELGFVTVEGHSIESEYEDALSEMIAAI
jgi:superfamily II DNA or RNA helicase